MYKKISSFTLYKIQQNVFDNRTWNKKHRHMKPKYIQQYTIYHLLYRKYNRTYILYACLVMILANHDKTSIQKYMLVLS